MLTLLLQLEASGVAMNLFKELGPFALVVLVILWVMKSLVPKSQDMLMQQSTIAKEMLEKQEEGGRRIIESILNELRVSRETFATTLANQEARGDQRHTRLYEAIERGNQLLLYLIALMSRGGELDPALMDILKVKNPAEKKEV